MRVLDIIADIRNSMAESGGILIVPHCLSLQSRFTENERQFDRKWREFMHEMMI